MKSKEQIMADFHATLTELLDIINNRQYSINDHLWTFLNHKLGVYVDILGNDISDEDMDQVERIWLA